MSLAIITKQYQEDKLYRCRTLNNNMYFTPMIYFNIDIHVYFLPNAFSNETLHIKKNRFNLALNIKYIHSLTKMIHT